jgi:hypothetical protein
VIERPFGADGLLEQFLHVGVDEKTVDAIGGSAAAMVDPASPMTGVKPAFCLIGFGIMVCPIDGQQPDRGRSRTAESVQLGWRPAKVALFGHPALYTRYASNAI